MGGGRRWWLKDEGQGIKLGGSLVIYSLVGSVIGSTKVRHVLSPSKVQQTGSL